MSPSSEHSNSNCMPRQMPSTGCVRPRTHSTRPADSLRHGGWCRADRQDHALGTGDDRRIGGQFRRDAKALERNLTEAIFAPPLSIIAIMTHPYKTPLVRRSAPSCLIACRSDLAKPLKQLPPCDAHSRLRRNMQVGLQIFLNGELCSIMSVGRSPT